MAEPLLAIDIDVSGLARLANGFAAAAKEVELEMEAAMTESGQWLTTRAAANTPVNYGLLRGSIQWPHGFELEKGGLMDILRGIVGAGDVKSATGVSTSTYVEFVEENTRPHWAPIQPLKLWAIRKLGDERAAYAVRWHIHLFGTRGAHMFRNAWLGGGKDAVKRIWEAVPRKVIERLRRSVR